MNGINDALSSTLLLFNLIKNLLFKTSSDREQESGIACKKHYPNPFNSIFVFLTVAQ